jgi:hypothetical protein
MSRFAAVPLVALLACGNDTGSPRCDPEWQSANDTFTGCRAALVFASRDTAELLPSQREVDRYFDRVQRLTVAAPELAIYPRMRLIDNSFDLTVNTTNPTLIAAWSLGILETGDVALDDMLSRIDMRLERHARDQGPYFSAVLSTDHIYNEEVLTSSLSARSASIELVYPPPRSDARWVWLDTEESTGTDDATAQIDIRIGGGDCFLGCTHWRYYTAVVPPDGSPTIHELDSDPLMP